VCAGRQTSAGKEPLVSLWMHTGACLVGSWGMQTVPDISVVVVTWNGRQYLEECLSAIEAQRGVRCETILVDNASTDGTADFVRSRFPAVRLIQLAENRGFA